MAGLYSNRYAVINLRSDILDMFLDAQLPVFDAARARFQDLFSGVAGGFGGSAAYRAKHARDGRCICCPRPARPNRRKCERCAAQTNAYRIAVCQG